MAIYSATKAALWSATNSLRLELHPAGVHVVGVHVGYVDTAMAADATDPKLDPADLVREVLRRRGGGRVRGARRRRLGTGQGRTQRADRSGLPAAPGRDGLTDAT